MEPYVTTEEPLQQTTFGWVGKLLPVQIWRPGAVWSKDVQIFKALSLNHLENRKKVMQLSQGWADRWERDKLFFMLDQNFGLDEGNKCCVQTHSPLPQAKCAVTPGMNISIHIWSGEYQTKQQRLERRVGKGQARPILRPLFQGSCGSLFPIQPHSRDGCFCQQRTKAGTPLSS